LLKPFAFPKTARILKRYEFVEFYSLGKAVHSSGFVLVYKRGQTGRSRIGITVSRKVGNAVVRNRIKRRTREYYRLHSLTMPKDWAFHVIAKKPAPTLSFQQTVAMLDGLFDKFAKIAVAAPAAILQSPLI
jgi:ribonuclease P protein component